MAENKTDSFFTQEAKETMQELLDINTGGGGGGGTSDYDDLTNKPSINGVPLSGNMNASDLGLAEAANIPDVSGLYTKPVNGIPKSDLADDVKTSLGKADTALQSFAETDPTVPSWAKAENKPTYTAQEVGALPANTAIPSIDNTLTTQGMAADAKATGDAIDEVDSKIQNYVVQLTFADQDETNGYTDKTVQEIVDAFNDGKRVILTGAIYHGNIDFCVPVESIFFDNTSEQYAIQAYITEIGDNNGDRLVTFVMSWDSGSGNLFMLNRSEFNAYDIVYDANNEISVGDAINVLNSTTVKSVNNQTPDNDGNVDVAVDQTLVDNAVEDWLDEHISQGYAVDDTLSVVGAAADAKKTGDEVAELKNALSEYSKIVETEEDTAELYIADASGNVIALFSDGHIQTKEFSSADVLEDISGKLDTNQGSQNAGKALVVQNDGSVSPEDIAVDVDDTLTQEGEAADAKAVGDAISEIRSETADFPKIAEVSENTADLYIVDKNGNVLVEIVNGHIKTKNFDSSKEQSLLFPTDSSANLDFSDSQGHVIMRLSDGNIKTKNFDNTLMTHPCEYLFSDGKLMLSYGYTDDVDAVISLGLTGANDLFEFHSFYTKPHSILLRDCRPIDLTQVWRAGTDLHSPFQFLAVNNPDGYNASSTDPSYTGGNHTMKVNGEPYKTASSRYVNYYANGVPVSSGCGVFDKFEIRWANNIQAYNCVKLDGTGRTSLIEYHDMVFDGIEFKEDVTLVPQEDIVLRLWHGFQTVAWATSVCDHVRFIEGANRNIYTSEDEGGNPISGNALTGGIVEWGDEHAIKMTVDVNYDLGKRQYYSGTQGAAMNAESHKGRFFIIYGQSVNMGEDTSYDLRGSYRFFSAINGEV